MAKEKAKKKTPAKTKKTVEILVHNCAGKYLIAANKGQKLKLENKQADEMIAAGDAKEIK